VLIKDMVKTKFVGTFNEVLESVKDFEIEIADMHRVHVIESLKDIKRTGKKIRFEKFNNPDIKVRSIYDHIHSLAKMAEIFLKEDVFICNEHDLACHIVYHDLCEFLISDFPTHTDTHEISSTPIQNVKNVDKEIRERYATKFLWLYGDSYQKECFEVLDNSDETAQIFEILDKIDPIINIWRYMYNYKEYVSDNAELFIKTLEDFFTYLRIKTIAEENRYPIISEIVAFLRNQENAMIYAKEQKIDSDKISKKAYTIIKVLIEETKLFY
jgi:5'-deoxynucleotidase YfbR-like HD superfamily hydrolase